MELRVSAIPSNDFIYIKATKTFVGEMSELGSDYLFQRIYDDAVDVGFGIRSMRTGNTKLFYFEDIVKDEEGDIGYWKFVSKCGTYKVKVFND